MIDHIGFAVSDYERSKKFYAQALAPLGYVLVMEVGGHLTESGSPAAGFGAGGRDNGAPGLRPHYHPNYYAAFVLDPDDHNIEAVCHKPG